MDKLLISILGPTGVGKTALALRLAELMSNAEIISVDTGSFYRDTNVGTAKPTPEERLSHKHWFIDVLDCHQTYSVASFVEDATQTIQTMWQQGKIPMIVAGTLYYYYALTGKIGYANIPPMEPVRQLLERELNEFGEEYLRNKLRNIDPDRESAIRRGDHKRLIRALEIACAGVKPSQAIKKNDLGSHLSIRVGLRMPREAYRSALRQRVKAMLMNGLVQEVERLRAQGKTCEMPCLSQIGYKEVCAYLDGGIKTMEELEERIFVRHWDYAKRQMTWLRKDQELMWFEHDGDVNAVMQEVWVHVKNTCGNC
ncbi:tRNA (adenosine(37)-N6)-dimethylallyltransferase MiaA [Coprothermobacteraceae bacterium]|nr:tRNA (adenosine(37)-N6)-dimethylallyltransferase MiaA [Coprothermobacteraceae bacterium]